MTNAEFGDLLSILAREESGIEVKGPGSLSDTYFRAKIVRAAIGMSNRRDGGKIIIGLDEDEQPARSFISTGLDPQQLASWQYDQIADAFAEYTEPVIRFDLYTPQYEGKDFVVLQIYEFDEYPVLCKKQYQSNFPNQRPQEVLRKGACYVRTVRKPETVEIPGYEDMRALVDLAIEKGVRRYLRVANQIGINISEAVRQTNEELFNRQAANWQPPLLERIHTRGNWQIMVHPEIFSATLLPNIADLFPFLLDKQVRLPGFGWSFPFPANYIEPVIGADWVGGEIEHKSHLDAWRFYQSGLLLYASGIWTDWGDGNLDEWRQIAPGGVLRVNEVLARTTQVFEFASRLAGAQELASTEGIRVCIKVDRILDRELWKAGYLPPPELRRAAIPSYTFDKILDRNDLMARPRQLAIEVATDLLYRFNGFVADPNWLQGEQERYYRGYA